MGKKGKRTMRPDERVDKPVWAMDGTVTEGSTAKPGSPDGVRLEERLSSAVRSQLSALRAAVEREQERSGAPARRQTVAPAPHGAAVENEGVEESFADLLDPKDAPDEDFAELLDKSKLDWRAFKRE